MTFYPGLRCGPKTKCLDFGGDSRIYNKKIYFFDQIFLGRVGRNLTFGGNPDYDPHPEVFLRDSIFTIAIPVNTENNAHFSAAASNELPESFAAILSMACCHFRRINVQ